MSSGGLDCMVVADRLEVLASRLSSAEGQTAGTPDYARDLARFAEMIRSASEMTSCGHMLGIVESLERFIESNDMAKVVEMLDEMRGLIPGIAAALRLRSAILVVNLFIALSVVTVSLQQVVMPTSLMALWVASITMGLGVAGALMASRRLSSIVLLFSSALLTYETMFTGSQAYFLISFWALVLSGASLILVLLARSMRPRSTTGLYWSTI